MSAHELLATLTARGVALTPLPGGFIKVKPASKLTPELRAELKQRKAEVLALLEARRSEHDRFLAKHAGATVTEVFSDLRGLLVKSAVLDMPVWVVRSRHDGEDLAKETGHPGLLVDDILQQRGKTPEEARAALFPLLILGTVQ